MRRAMLGIIWVRQSSKRSAQKPWVQWTSLRPTAWTLAKGLAEVSVMAVDPAWAGGEKSNRKISRKKKLVVTITLTPALSHRMGEGEWGSRFWAGPMSIGVI